MKNKLVLVPLISLALVALTGCTIKKANLTFGTYIEQSLDSLKPIETSEMLDKAYSEETYILATYQGKYSNECLCWSTFQNVIVNYINKYHARVREKLLPLLTDRDDRLWLIANTEPI